MIIVETSLKQLEEEIDKLKKYDTKYAAGALAALLWIAYGGCRPSEQVASRS